ncbi:DUF202 domain-containing protein [Buttiauxella selenatireducens]|uniref:DUF202 domain-containing protein n=1 Tax=Buttiauxella selenatireducens TaxID=3073902 RepID=A0ABY9S4U4_9ENTR|nr:DUF202 domain-containing protein [Buttiauxella sp. R73]WMY72528.1 DUF202 domain-containing protein [Buttiauxella sp. R73]
MNIALRERDPGLQPERTALSWHRTAFSSLVLALATVRAGFVNADILLAILGSASAVVSLVLVWVSLRRQRQIVCDTRLTTPGSAMAKCLICLALGLNALAITLHTLVRLF